jgi:hypothetical protein
MANDKQFEFFLLRYGPDAVKDEFVNIGVVLLGDGTADLRFTHDFSRVKCLDPAADIELLASIEAELRQQLQAGGDSRALILKKLDDSFSNTIQLSGTKAVLAEDAQTELDALAKMYLETRRVSEASIRMAGARSRIASRMREAFETAGVWELMLKKIKASDYGMKGDPLKIDCGYRPNGIVKMFHGVSLANDVDGAKVLAFSYPLVRHGIANKLNAKSELTAIVDTADRGDEQIAFALDTLTKAEIRIANIAEINAIAENARRELKI